MSSSVGVRRPFRYTVLLYTQVNNMANREITNDAGQGVICYEDGLEVVGQPKHLGSGSHGLQLVLESQGNDKILAGQKRASLEFPEALEISQGNDLILASGRTSSDFPEAVNQQHRSFPKQDGSVSYHQENSDQELLSHLKQQQRRYCGLPFLALLLVLVVGALVVVGAVLGGVLGTTLHQEKGEDTCVHMSRPLGKAGSISC